MVCISVDSKLIEISFPGVVALNKLTVNDPNAFECVENQEQCIAAARAIGCSVVNIGGRDLALGTPHLVLGLAWQIIKKSLLAKESIHFRPSQEKN